MIQKREFSMDPKLLGMQKQPSFTQLKMVVNFFQYKREKFEKLYKIFFKSHKNEKEEIHKSVKKEAF